MMTANESWPEPEFGATQVAHGMGEALDYLIGIALAAGLVDIARKLDDANADLIAVKFDDPGSTPRKNSASNGRGCRPTRVENLRAASTWPTARRPSEQ